MRRILAIIVVSAITLPGCATPVATAVVVGVLAADAMNEGKMSMYRAPEPDPSRTINVQDCTQPVDYGAGNLMCR